MRIEAAAIRVIEGDVYSLPPPARHGHVLLEVGSKRPGWRQRDGDEQGFITECGRFLTRRQAKAVAIKSGQASPPFLSHVFTSEELW